MALAPNTGFGLLNRGTTLPAAPTGQPAAAAPAPPPPPFQNPFGNALQQVAASQLPAARQTFDQAQASAQSSAPPAIGHLNQVYDAAASGGAPPTGQTSPFDVNTFPGVNNSLALEQQGLGQLDANLNQQRQQAIINFGDPNLASLAGFGLDPQAGAFAHQNYLSGNATLARLDKAHKLAAQDVINHLAAHGILNSGDLGYLEGNENQAYGNNVYDAQQSVLSQLAGLYQNYLSGRQGLEQNVNDSQLAALNQYLQNPDAFAQLFGPSAGNGSQPASAGANRQPAQQPADAVARYLGGGTTSAVTHTPVVRPHGKPPQPSDAVTRYLFRGTSGGI